MIHSAYLNCVSSYADNVLRWARDKWASQETPLLVDGLEVSSHEPAPWKWGGRDRIPCDFANQQHFMRVLVGLSAFTGDKRWAAEAKATASYVLDHLQHETGLLHWGGHVAWDLIHDEPFGHAIGRPHHELKCHYPFYELMWQVNPQATQKYVEGYWDAHVQNWSNLDISRHGAYTPPERHVPMWQDEFEDGPLFFVGEGLSFVNAGSDLYFAAAMLHSFNRQTAPLKWARSLAKRYHDTADERTGLVGYQFSQIVGDRAQGQLGPEFGPKALEGKTLTRGGITIRYAAAGLIQFQLGEQLGAEGEFFQQWAHKELAALVTQAYDFDANLLLPMFTDGTPILPEDLKRPGYYGPASFTPGKPEPKILRTYATAYRITRDPLMWRMASRIAQGHGLGDWGSNPENITGLTGSSSVNASTLPADVDLVYGVLELWRASGQDAFGKIAVALADKLVDEYYRDGLFLPHRQQRYARIDSRVPLALLHVAAALEHGPDQMIVPVDRGGRVEFSCEHDTHPLAAKSKHRRVSDDLALYAPLSSSKN